MKSRLPKFTAVETRNGSWQVFCGLHFVGAFSTRVDVERLASRARTILFVRFVP